jgi:glycosyltransferase involved in cell wall biosynthesis
MTEPQEQRRRPLVSVCIPTYNRRALLEETLQTLKNQTLEDYELIVCDDASADGTFEFLSSLRWPNLKVLRNSKNLNLPGTLTRLFLEANGKYIGMQHDHDLYHPNFLERMVELMERHPTAGFGCSAFDTLDRNGRIVEPPESWFQFYPASGLRKGQEVIRVLATRVATPIPAMGTMFRRDIVELSGGYRPDWYIASDEDLYRRVAAVSDVAFSRERLFVMRPRPMDRQFVFGSWQAIYTLHELRVDTTKRFLKAGIIEKHSNIIRLWILRLRALLKECVSLSVRSQYGELAAATNLLAIPALPGHGPRLSIPEKILVQSWISLLKLVCRATGGRIRPRSRGSIA